jgi:hypothetical protein
MEKYWKVTQKDVGRELGNPNYITYLETLLKDQSELWQDDLYFIKKAIANLSQASLITKNSHTDTIVRGVRNTLKGLVILINEARKENE